MRPSHHPNDEASTQMAIDYLEYSPGRRKAARERAHRYPISADKEPEVR